MISSRSLFAVSFLLATASASLAQMAGVLNLPYTAVKKTTVVQKLADGTTITRVTNRTEARDSQGRVMQKEDLMTPDVNHAEPRPYTVMIQDVSAHTLTRWNVPGKQVFVNHLPMHPPIVKAASPHTLASSAPPPSSGTGGIVAYVSSGVSGAPSPNTTSNNLQPTFKQEKLEGKVINGVYAEGNRVTRTYPTGFFGNDRPIVQVSENWNSPDLKIIVAGTNEDPRSGTTSIELISLDRAEPDPSLFTPPQGYEIKDVDIQNQSQ